MIFIGNEKNIGNENDESSTTMLTSVKSGRKNEILKPPEANAKSTNLLISRGKAFTSLQQYHQQTITTITPARLSS